MAKSISKSKTLFKKAYYHNWDGGTAALHKILEDSNCDKATALMIFWHGQPGYYYDPANIDKLTSYEQEMYDFLKSVANDILSNKYPSVISYEVESSFIPAALGTIPEELLQPTKGEVHYKEVLHPNDNPFDEQIMALCKDCDDVNKMYELEKSGANFNLKINKGYSYPILYASSSGQTEALQYFIDKKFDLNKKYNKRPLFWGAILNKQISTLKLILENGGKINQKGEFGRTILHEIAGVFAQNQDGFDKELHHIITFLIENGADMNALDTDKKTPLDLSLLWNNTKYIQFINQIQKEN